MLILVSNVSSLVREPKPDPDNAYSITLSLWNITSKTAGNAAVSDNLHVKFIEAL